jgi:hypothetical protein
VNARVYAVRANYNRLLDVARETYKENVGDIFALCRELSGAHELPLQLVYQEGAGGFVFALKRAEVEDAGGLPKGFINAVASKGRVVFSSLELVSELSRKRLLLTGTQAKAERTDEGCVGRNTLAQRQVCNSTNLVYSSSRLCSGSYKTSSPLSSRTLVHYIRLLKRSPSWICCGLSPTSRSVRRSILMNRL